MLKQQLLSRTAHHHTSQVTSTTQVCSPTSPTSVSSIANSVGASHNNILVNFVVTTHQTTNQMQNPLMTTLAPSSRPPSLAMDTRNLNPQLNLHLSCHDGGDHHKRIGISFHNDASKEGRDANGATII